MTHAQDATARRILRTLANHLAAHADDPAADVLTLAAQAEQTAGLVRAEVADGRTAEPEPASARA